MKHKIILLRMLIVLLVPTLSFVAKGQLNNKALEKKIADYLSNVRNGKSSAPEYHFDSSNERHFLTFIKKQEQDTSQEVRFRIQIIMLTIGRESKNISIRQDVVETFLKEYIINPISRDGQYAMFSLKQFNEPDFSDSSRRMMTTAFDKLKNASDYLLLCGTLQLKELLPKIQKVAAEFTKEEAPLSMRWWQTNAWYASLAAARMGDPVNNDKMITAVELEMRDGYTSKLNLLKLLAYTRQTDCLRLVQVYLNSSDTVPGMHGRPGFPYNQYVLDYLAEYMEGFPIEKNKYGPFYNQQQLEAARAFMNSWWMRLHTGN